MSMLPQLRTRAPHLRAPRPPRRPLAVGPAEASDHVVDCAIYADGRRRPGSCTPADIAAMRRAGDGFVWLGLHDPTEAEFAGIGRALRPAPAGGRGRASAAHQRPKLDRYEDTLFTVFKTVRYVEHPALDRPTERGGGDRRDHGLRRPRLRDHRPARRATAACAPCAARLEAGPGAAGQGPVRGAARDHGPDRGRLPGRGGRHAVDIDEVETDVFATAAVPPGRRADLPAQARGARAEAGGDAAGRTAADAVRAADAAGATRRSGSTSGTSPTTCPG